MVEARVVVLGDGTAKGLAHAAATGPSATELPPVSPFVDPIGDGNCTLSVHRLSGNIFPAVEGENGDEVSSVRPRDVPEQPLDDPLRHHPKWLRPDGTWQTLRTRSLQDLTVPLLTRSRSPPLDCTGHLVTHTFRATARLAHVTSSGAALPCPGPSPGLEGALQGSCRWCVHGMVERRARSCRTYPRNDRDGAKGEAGRLPRSADVRDGRGRPRHGPGPPVSTELAGLDVTL